MAQNKNVIYALSGVAAALLVALVGIVAYNMGKDKSDESTTTDSSNSTELTTTSNSTSSTALDMTSAQTEQPQEPEPDPIDVLAMEHWHLTGTIAGQGVVMELDNDGGTLSGSYYYTKFGHPNDALQLNGSIGNNGNIYLDEFDANEGYDSGYMEGHLSMDGHFSGTHHRYENGANTRIRLNVEL